MANLVAGLKWFLGTYTSQFNRRHKLFVYPSAVVLDVGADLVQVFLRGAFDFGRRHAVLRKGRGGPTKKCHAAS